MATFTIAISVLSACGGDLVNKLDELTDKVERAGHEASFDEYIDKAANLDAEDVPIENLPNVAQMVGYLSIENDDGIVKRYVVGSADIQAIFDSNNMTGSVTDFATFVGSAECRTGLPDCTGIYVEELGGTLNITGNIVGTVSKTTFKYAINGTLTGDSYSANIGTETNLSGIFGTTGTKIVAKAEGDNISVDFSNTDGTNETVGSIANLYLEEEIVP